MIEIFKHFIGVLLFLTILIQNYIFTLLHYDASFQLSFTYIIIAST